MSKQRHVIKKQILEIQLSSQQEAFEIQNKISQIYRSKVVPLMDDLFSEFSNPDLIHRIDVLEIDIEDIDINNLEKEFINKVLKKIKQQLAEKITQTNSSFSTQPQPNKQRVTQLKNEDEKDIKKQKNQRKSSFRDTSFTSVINQPQSLNTSPTQTTSQLELFSYFIQTGTLPWWAKKLSKQELEEQLDNLINSSPNEIKSIIRQSFTNERHLQRIIYQFSDTSLSKITQILSPDISHYIINYNNDIKAIFKQIEILKPISPAQLRLEHWRGIFLSLYLTPNTNPSNTQFTRDVLLHLATSLTINYSSLIEPIIQVIKRLEKEGFNFKSQLSQILTSIYQTFQTQDNKLQYGSDKLEQKPAFSSRESSSQEEAETEILYRSQNELERSSIIDTENRSFDDYVTDALETNVNLGKNSSQEEVDREIFNPFKNTIESFSDCDESYIFNAGLILLWPFITRFFETIGLVQERNFINSNAAQRAVLLLQFLVDASTESPEHILPLNKVLCGIDLLEPIEANLDITEQEQEECENLLSAVIQNWSILKNTSIAGLRSAFLQREGILKRRDRSLLLQVEQQTHDILLDRIPWSIRVIKLPWMDEVLYVEW